MNDLWIRLSANKKLDPSANYDKNKERKDGKKGQRDEL